MAQDIKVGSNVKVTVVKDVTNEAARKTIARILAKDADIAAEHKRLRKSRDRHLRLEARGGREWAVRVIKQHPIQGKSGETGTVLATVDVINDLNSVKKFVEVSAT